MKDVAAAAGVSLSTVSYVLSGKKTVKPETMKRILDAASSTGYELSYKEKNILIGKRGTIGVLLPEMGHYAWAHYYYAIEKQLKQNNFSIACAFGHNKEACEIENINRFIYDKVDGVIFMGVAEASKVQAACGITPVVFVDRLLPSIYTSVMQNYYRGSYISTQYLIEKGYSKIAYLVVHLRYATYLDGLRGYIDAMHDHSISYNNDLVWECECSSEDAYNMTKKQLEKNSDIDAIIVAGENTGLGVFCALHDLGKRIPEDVAFLCLNDGGVGKLLHPPITALQIPYEEIGNKAVEILDAQIQEKETKAQQVQLDPTLIVREST